MAAKKSKKKSRLSQEQKDNIIKYSGLAVAGLTLFTFVSLVSYLFTWKVDESNAADPQLLNADVEFSNLCGKTGYLWSELLVSKCFGLGSFVLVFLLGATAYKLFFKNREFGLLRVTFLSISGAFVSSLVFAFFSALFGGDNAFGGGLGGDAGCAVVSFSASLMGMIVTGFIILLLVVGWLLLCSSRFRHWFAVVGDRKPQDPSEEAEDEAAENEETDDEPEDEEAGNEETEDEGEDLVGDDVLDDGIDPLDDEEIQPDSDLPSDAESGAGQKTADGEVEVIRGEGLVVTETEDLPPFDNRLDLEKFQSPPLDLLDNYSSGQHAVTQLEIDNNNNRIRATLLDHKVEVLKVTAVVGPTVTLYKVYPAPGVKVAQIETVHREIAMSLGVSGVRVVMLPDCVGIEVPNSTPSIVPLKSMLNSDKFRNSKAELPVAIGYTITQEVKTFDLADAPHLLVAGATKQGKSVGLNVIISSLLYAKHPSELKFVFIDPKKVEFTAYNHLLKHYLAVLPSASEEEEQKNAIVKSAKMAEQVLASLCIEMDQRYGLLEAAGVNDFKLYNEKFKKRRLLPTDGHKFLPYLVVVIDEYSDLLMAGGSNPEAKKSARNIESSIVRLAQMGRAAGIHVIIATQRPSADVVTGLIRANFPTRIAFRVLSNTESRIILDSNGAENLIGKGDMLYYAGVRLDRVQCALISMDEIRKVTKFIGDQTGYKKSYNIPYYLPVPESPDGEGSGGAIDMQNIDPLFEEAARMVVNSQRGSTSDLQRRMGMGYARAGRVMDQLEGAGIVGPQEGSKPRQVLVSNIMELDEILSHFVK